MMFRSYIGLEIHIQLLSKTKVFCGCKAAFGDEPNSNVCPICLGYPGVLPSLNEEAIEMAYLVAKALSCTLSRKTVFERKNYFYPDLPKNYQISQFSEPIGRNGYIDLEFHRSRKRIRIHECHLEEDAGKMIHAGDMSLIDFNRAGTALLEIVTEPDMEIGEEAEVLLQQLRRMVRYLGVCDGNMEEGSMRCDANVSVNYKDLGLGQKVEIKNMNSSRFVKRALNYEINRQEEIIERGGTIIQETRLWNENRDVSETMRVKESANDYRFFPEPDLPPFTADDAFLERVENRMVELPTARHKRFIEEYGLSELQADFITEEKDRADFFEESVRRSVEPLLAAAWMAADVKKMLNRYNSTLNEGPLSVKRFSQLLLLLQEGRIHGKIAKQTLEAVFKEEKDPEIIIKERNWEQINDRKSIEAFVNTVIGNFPEIVETIREGDSKPVKFLMGQIMKESSGRVDPQKAQEILNERLSVRLVHVLGFGGAISGVKGEDGMIDAGTMINIRSLFEKAGEKSGGQVPAKVQFETIQLGSFLSEEINPHDWASLVRTISELLQNGNSSGIVIAHGTDTLSYTASLLYWLFSRIGLPIILTAAFIPPGFDGDAEDNLRGAIALAMTKESGVYVSFGEEEYEAINLKFETIPKSASEKTGLHTAFRNWNLDTGHLKSLSPPSSFTELELDTLTGKLEEIITQIFIAKVYPGMRSDFLISLINGGVRYIILELYDTGTANLRESPFSLRKAIAYGNERGVKFYCSSQQEGIVDFSEYVTSHALWKEGAVPMGALTTESVYTRLIAAMLLYDDVEEVEKLMEES